MSHTGNWAPKVIHCASDFTPNNPDRSLNSTATFQLSRPVYVPADYQMSISCISAVIPYSFWTIPTAIAIPFSYTGSVSGSTLTQFANMTIPAGNYSAPALATLLSHSNSNLTVTYNSSLGVFQFTTGGTFSITIPAQAVNTFIGLPASGQSIAVNSTITAPLCPQIMGPKAISINTDIPLNTVTAGVGNAQTLCFVPVDVNPNQYIVYRPGNGIPIKQIVQTNYISEVRITLLDEAGNPLDFKGLPWAVDLCFELLTPPDMVGHSYTEQVEGGSLFDANRRTPAETRAYVAL